MAIQLQTARGQRCSACAHHALHPAQSIRMQLVSRPPSDKTAIERNTPHQTPGADPWCLPRWLHAAGSLCHDSTHRPHVSTLLTLTFRLAGLDKLCQHPCARRPGDPLSRSPALTPWNTAWSAAPSTRTALAQAGQLSTRYMAHAPCASLALQGGCQRGT